jgi:hypothetical protein
MISHNSFSFTAILIILFGLLASSSAFAQDEWPYYGGNQWGERHDTFTHNGVRSVWWVQVGLCLPLVFSPYHLPMIG